MPNTVRRPRHSSPKIERPSRHALVRAIEQKVQHLSLGRLKHLAAELGVEPEKEANPPTQHLAGKGLGMLLSQKEGQARLDALSVDDASLDWAASDLYGAGDMAEILNVSRATLDNWRTANKVIAFRKGVRNYIYPARQFERFGPVDGLDRVLGSFASPEQAWEWLVTPNRYTNNEAPIDRLRSKHIDEVSRAAEGSLDFQ